MGNMKKRKIFQHIFLVSFFWSSCVFASNSPKKVVVPLIDGMVLKLGNVVQQIEVRAKSMGPGKCAVEISAEDETIGILAPLTKMSDWKKVGPAFLGEGSAKMGFRIICDTGAIGQVRYFPKD